MGGETGQSMADLITSRREEIETRSRDAFLARSMPRPTQQELEDGIPGLIDQLVETLRRGTLPVPEDAIEVVAGRYGGRLFSLGFTISEIVHAYGAVCETVMGIARELGVQFAPAEFEMLNRVLDVAIAAAVTEYQRRQREELEDRDVQHIGVLAHELRNALSSAALAFELIKNGTVGVRGRTADVLEHSLMTMRDLLDRALAEVRLESNAAPILERIRVADVLDQVAAALQSDAERRDQSIDVQVDHDLAIDVDRQLVTSAVSNLVQNALKYTHAGGHISVRGGSTSERVYIEIEDECGGLPTGAVEDLFKPFVRSAPKQPGVGLGLSIVERAVTSLGGEVRVRDLPGKGCVFTIELPRSLPAEHHAPGP